MRKIRIILIVIVGLIIIWRLFLELTGTGQGWPISITPPIEGQVVDATTKKPIENVVVGAVYYKEVPALADSVRKSFDSYIIITGKDGKFRIPRKISFYIWSVFAGRNVSVAHPLYLSGFYNTGDPEITETKDGIIHYDMRLMGVGERYLGEEVRSQESGVRSEEEKKRRFEMWQGIKAYLQIHENGWYWLTLKEKNIPFDLEETFKVWDEIVKKYSYSSDDDLTEALKETKIKIRNQVGDEKQ